MLALLELRTGKFDARDIRTAFSYGNGNFFLIKYEKSKILFSNTKFLADCLSNTFIPLSVCGVATNITGDALYIVC